LLLRDTDIQSLIICPAASREHRRVSPPARLTFILIKQFPGMGKRGGGAGKADERYIILPRPLRGIRIEPAAMKLQ